MFPMIISSAIIIVYLTTIASAIDLNDSPLDYDSSQDFHRPIRAFARSRGNGG